MRRPRISKTWMVRLLISGGFAGLATLIFFLTGAELRGPAFWVGVALFTPGYFLECLITGTYRATHVNGYSTHLWFTFFSWVAILVGLQVAVSLAGARRRRQR